MKIISIIDTENILIYLLLFIRSVLNKAKDTDTIKADNISIESLTSEIGQRKIHNSNRQAKISTYLMN